MSSSFYPLGMNSYNNRLPQGGYKSSKGTGVFSNPTGVTAGNIRPLTNNDPSNSVPQKFGLPRPIKHYRKGISVTSLDNSTNSRQVKSSTGGGSLIGQMIDIPGGFSIKENPSNEISNTEELDRDCLTCQGVGIISDWQPITDLTEKPEPETQTPQYCCNEERNSLRRLRSANTKLKKNYYTSTTNYLYNRCQTFEQKQFNYLSTGNAATKPGAPLSQNNTYNANCNPNLEIEYATSLLSDGITLTPSNPLGCETVQYKPNNYKYGQQGAVSSSDRLLRLNVETIDTNRANIIKSQENLTKSKYFPNASGSENNSCCIIGSKAVSSFGTTILYITYPLVTRTFRTLTHRFSFPSSFSSISDAPVPVIQNEYILVVPSYELIDTNKVKMTLKYQLFTNNDTELLTVGLSFANNVNYYNQNTSIIEIIQFDGMPLYGLGNQFSGLTPEILISAPDEPRIINGTSALNCFKVCPNFNSPGILNWNIANVVNLQGIFAYATLFNQPIGGWDTSNVTNMSYMFYGASAFNQDISMLDTSAVENMSFMFEDATIFNNGEPGIQTISGTDASSNYIDSTRTLSCPNGLFLTELSLNDGIVISTSAGVVYSSQIQPPIVSDVSLVLLTAYGGNLTAGSITSIQKIPTSVGGTVPLSLWNTGNVQNMKKMFQYALSFNQYIGDWDTHSVTEMSSMFVFASSFNNGQISGLSGASLNAWNTGSVTLMNNMFQNATAFNQPIGDWDTHSVTDMQVMFRITQFNQPLITNGNKWNTGIVKNMRYMFIQTSAFNQDIGNWDTARVTDMAYMFYKALAFNNGDSGNNGLKPLNNWNTQSVTNMQSMFYSVPTFNQDVTNWDVTNVTDMANMFALATNFNNGDITNIGSKSLSSWYAPLCTNFATMFLNVVSFNQDISNLVDTSGITDPSGVDLTSMFQSATLFNNGQLGTMDISGNAATSFYTNVTATLYSPTALFNSQLTTNDVLIITSGTPATIIYTSKIQTIISDASLVLLTPYGTTLAPITSIKKQVAGSAPLTWNTINVTNIASIFQNATYFNQRVDQWSTSNVTIMERAFSSRTSPLQNIFNNGKLAGSSVDTSLNNWNTGNVTTMSQMFRMTSGFNQYIGGWNVSKVTTMGGMFYFASVFNNGSLAGLSDASLNSWNTSNVTDMASMFQSALAFNQPISNWDTSNVTTMNTMFYNTSIFNQNIGNWDTRSVTNMQSTFQNSIAFNNGRPLGTNDTSLNWYAPKCDNFTGMFRSASSFNQAIPILVDSSGIILDGSGNGVTMDAMFQSATMFNQNLNTWNTSKVSNMSSVFSTASVFNNGDASGANTTPLNWITDNVTTMSAMFVNALVFNQPIDTSGNYWKTGKVTNMFQMLAGGSVTLLFNQPIGRWDVSNCTTMGQMFYGANKFNQDISLWKTGNVTTMFQMFRNATLFNQTINTDASGSWNVSKVTDMSSMFLSATAFNNGSLTNDGANDLSWNAPNCTNFTSMFQSATTFNQKVNNLVNTANVIDCSLNSMFQAATIFNNGQIGTMDISGSAPFTYTDGTRLLTSTGSKFLTDLSSNDVLIITASGVIYTSQIQPPIVSDISLVLLTAYGGVLTPTTIKKQVAGTADLSWNTTNVKNMSSLFLGAYYFNQNINNWSTSNVTNMSSMFATGSTTLRNMFNNGQLAGSTDVSLNWYAPKCTTFASMFAYTSGFKQPMPFLVDTSGITLDASGNGVSLASMFQNTPIFNQNLNTWNVSKVTAMNLMFSSATSFNNGRPLGTNDTSLNWYAPACTTFASMFLTANSFNQPIPSLVDTSGNTNPSGCTLTSMFQNAAVFNQNLNTWNVSRVTNMSSMFLRTSGTTAFNNGRSLGVNDTSLNWYAPNCTTFSLMFSGSAVFNQPIPSLVDTSGISLTTGCDLSQMFRNAAVFNQNLNGWNVSKVRTMILTFSGTIFNNGDISGNSTQPLTWYAPNCTSFSTIFNAVSAFNQPLPYLVDTSGNTDPAGCSLNAMFQAAAGFNQNLNTWNVSRATSISLTFSGASAFNNGSLTNDASNTLIWNAPMCTTFASMFLTANSFNQPIPILVDTSGVTGCNLNTMFQQATRFNQNLNTWNVSRVTNMSLMFQSATSFNNGSLTNDASNTLIWYAPICTSFVSMFQSATAFNQPIPFLVDTSGVAVCAMNSMFVSATSFNQNIGSWNVSKANPMNNMFSSATSFNNGGSNTIQTWYAPICTSFVSMFQSATAFNQPIPFLVDTSGVAVCAMNSMFASATAFNQNIGSWNVSKATTLASMFSSATSFNNGGSTGIQNWSAPASTAFNSMFQSATVFNQPLTNLVNTSSVANCVMNSMFVSATAFNNGQLLPPDISGTIASASYTVGTSILSVPGAAFNADLSLNDVLIIRTSSIYYTSQIQRIISDASLVLLTPGSSIASGITSIKKQVAGTADLSWNTQNVTTMVSMFQNAYYFNQNISNWSTSNVVSMTLMFAGLSTTAETTFNNGQLAGSSGQPLNWTASKCNNFNSMFANTAGFNQPVPTLVDTSTLPLANCTMTNMFNSASVFNQNVNTWNTSNVTNMSSMFSGTSVFNNGQSVTQTVTGTPSLASYSNASPYTLTCPDASFNLDFSSGDGIIITTGGSAIYSSVVANISSDTSLTLSTYPISISLAAGVITSIKKQVAGTADLSWNTQLVTTTASMFQNATYFNQRLPWNMRLNRNVTSMFAGTTTTFINLFNNGQILTGTSQPLNPIGQPIWDFSGVTVASIIGGGTNAWHTPSRLTALNGVTANPALTF